MAKKSAASLSVVAPVNIGARLLAPKFLAARQKEIWKDIVTAKPAGWFDCCNAPLLSGYVSAIASHEILALRAQGIEATLLHGEGDLKTLNKIHGMIERQARLMQTLATKLRLTQQSRYTPATAAVAAGKAAGRRPWDENP